MLKHSDIVGETVGVHAKTVRLWVTEFCKDGKFVVRERKYSKQEPHSFINEEGVQEQCREHINGRIYSRKQGEPRFRIADFQR